jgi:hypothetical protein
MSTIELSQAEADALVALREAAHEVIEKRQYAQTLTGSEPVGVSQAFQRLREAVQRADAVGFKPKPAPKRARKAKA